MREKKEGERMMNQGREREINEREKNEREEREPWKYRRGYDICHCLIWKTTITE